jgi:hypothetical protein
MYNNIVIITTLFQIAPLKVGGYLVMHSFLKIPTDQDLLIEG